MNEAVSAALPFAFGAFAIWSMISFINQSEKVKKVKQSALAFAVILVVYVLSFGPVFWIRARICPTPHDGIINDALHAIYCPLGVLTAFGPEIIQNALTWYVGLGATTQLKVIVPISSGNWIAVVKV